MALQLTIVKFPPGVSPKGGDRMVGPQGVSLGRGTDNSWPLLDPERYLSSKHCQIVFQNNQFLLLDMSTNGTFVNGGSDPLGRGSSHTLTEGDQFDIGEYRFKVSLKQQDGFYNPAFDGDIEDSGLSTASSGVVEHEFGKPLGAAESVHMGAFYQGMAEDVTPKHLKVVDPLELLDHAVHNRIPGDSLGLSSSSPVKSGVSLSGFLDARPSAPDDVSNFLSDALAWPEAQAEKSLIPDDWDADISLIGKRKNPVSSEDSWLPQSSHPSPPLKPPAEPPKHPIKSVSLSDDFMSELAPASSKPSPLAAEYVEQPQAQYHREARGPALRNEPVAQPEPSLVESALRSKLPPNTQDPLNRMRSLESTGSPAMRAGAVKPPAHPVSNESMEAPVNPSKSRSPSIEKALLEALGLQETQFSDDEFRDLCATLGALVRESVDGLIQVLRSRTSIKNQFRINITTIQPTENNPIKFSATVDEALDLMFVRKSRAYKGPLDAVEESFRTIADHQIAVIAGIRSAFQSSMMRFDPAILEEDFRQTGKLGVMPNMLKGRMWSAYQEHYQKLMNDMDRSFQDLFGDEFVQAYEDQMRKLAQNRKRDF